MALGSGGKETDGELLASDAATRIFDLPALAGEFPAAAGTMLLDRYLLDTPERSVRIFRVYQPTPVHFHRGCDETLLVLSGQGRFWSGNADQPAVFRPGMLLCFPRGTLHAMPEIEAGEPVVFLAVDTPRRDPADVVFLEGSAADFIAAV